MCMDPGPVALHLCPLSSQSFCVVGVAFGYFNIQRSHGHLLSTRYSAEAAYSATPVEKIPVPECPPGQTYP